MIHQQLRSPFFQESVSPMNFSFISGEAARASGELLVIPLFEGELGDKSPAPLAGADKALDGKLAAAAAQEGFKGKGEQSFVMHTLGRLEAERLALLGLGSRARYTPEALRLAAGRAGLGPGLRSRGR